MSKSEVKSGWVVSCEEPCGLESSFTTEHRINVLHTDDWQLFIWKPVSLCFWVHDYKISGYFGNLSVFNEAVNINTVDNTVKCLKKVPRQRDFTGKHQNWCWVTGTNGKLLTITNLKCIKHKHKMQKSGSRRSCGAFYSHCGNVLTGFRRH